jgi:hypothetical protein
MRKSMRKLSLNRETVRNLEDTVIREALGNVMPTWPGNCNESLPRNCDTSALVACLPATVPCAPA